MNKILYYGMELAPDGKIYFPTSDRTVGVIAQPNVKGMGCQFNDTALACTSKESENFLTFGFANVIEGTAISLPEQFFTSSVLPDTISAGAIDVSVALTPTTTIDGSTVFCHFDPSIAVLVDVSIDRRSIPISWRGADAFSIDIPSNTNTSSIRMNWQLIRSNTLSSISFSIDSVLVNGNRLSCESNPQQISLEPVCGAQLVSELLRMGSGPHFSIESNPANEQVNVKGPAGLGTLALELFDQLGRPVEAMPSSYDNLTGMSVADVRTVSSGSYFLRVNVGGQVTTLPVQVQH